MFPSTFLFPFFCLSGSRGQVILANTAVLGLDRYPTPGAYDEAVMFFLNLVFTFIFTIEVLLKLVTEGSLRATFRSTHKAFFINVLF